MNDETNTGKLSETEAYNKFLTFWEMDCSSRKSFGLFYQWLQSEQPVSVKVNAVHDKPPINFKQLFDEQCGLVDSLRRQVKELEQSKALEGKQWVLVSNAMTERLQSQQPKEGNTIPMPRPGSPDYKFMWEQNIRDRKEIKALKKQLEQLSKALEAGVSKKRLTNIYDEFIDSLPRFSKPSGDYLIKRINEHIANLNEYIKSLPSSPEQPTKK